MTPRAPITPSFSHQSVAFDDNGKEFCQKPDEPYMNSYMRYLKPNLISSHFMFNISLKTIRRCHFELQRDVNRSAKMTSLDLIATFVEEYINKESTKPNLPRGISCMPWPIALVVDPSFLSCVIDQCWWRTRRQSTYVNRDKDHVVTIKC